MFNFLPSSSINALSLDINRVGSHLYMIHEIVTKNPDTQDGHHTILYTRNRIYHPKELYILPKLKVRHCTSRRSW